MTLAKIHEMAEVLPGRRPRRLVPERSALPDNPPLVSIHIPAYREPPQMLKETLDSVAALDYPNFEAVVIINNTPEESYWAPIEAHCRALGARFKFLNIPKLSGFKAGALNEALKVTAPQAEVVITSYSIHYTKLYERKLPKRKNCMTVESRNPETIALHAAYRADPSTGSVAVPIHQTTSYQFNDTEHATRITSYNVCYTKILRGRRFGASPAPRWRRKARHPQQPSAGSLLLLPSRAMGASDPRS